MGKSNQEELALLVAQTGPLIGQRWPLGKTTTIGRDISCDIVVPDRQVSRHHIQLTVQPEGIMVEDLGSKNGTHLNGKLLEGLSRLQDGDVIQIAVAQQFVFLSSDATLPLEVNPSNIQTDYLPIRASQDQPAMINDNPTPTSGRLRLEPRSRRVWISVLKTPQKSASLANQTSEIEIDPPLSASQYRLLEMLYESQGRVITRQDVITTVWGEDEAVGVSDQALDALVRRLRDRIAAIDQTHIYIVTIRGHGLRLDNPPVDPEK